MSEGHNHALLLTACRSDYANFLFKKFQSMYSIYRVRQKYLTNLQNSCEWKRWRGEFVLESPSSESQSISAAMER